MPPPVDTTGAAPEDAPVESDVERLDVLWELRHIRDELPDILRQAYGRQNMAAKEINKLDLMAEIAKWQRFPGDTGSTEVQIAVITFRLKIMSEHLARLRKDYRVKRRIDMLVHQRERLLKYLRRTGVSRRVPVGRGQAR